MSGGRSSSAIRRRSAASSTSVAVRSKASAVTGSVTLRLRPGTQPGSRHRVKGRGIAAEKSSGDLIVTVDVTVPTSLTNEQREALLAYAKEESA